MADAIGALAPQAQQALTDYIDALFSQDAGPSVSDLVAFRTYLDGLLGTELVTTLVDQQLLAELVAEPITVPAGLHVVGRDGWTTVEPGTGFYATTISELGNVVAWNTEGTEPGVVSVDLDNGTRRAFPTTGQLLGVRSGGGHLLLRQTDAPIAEGASSTERIQRVTRVGVLVNEFNLQQSGRVVFDPSIARLLAVVVNGEVTGAPIIAVYDILSGNMIESTMPNVVPTTMLDAAVAPQGGWVLASGVLDYTSDGQPNDPLQVFARDLPRRGLQTLPWPAAPQSRPIVEPPNL